MKTLPIITFIATVNAARARRFYAGTLRLPLVSEDAFALVFDAGGTMLRVVRVQTLQPAAYTVLGWIVPDIGKAVRDLKRRGVTFSRYEGLAQDERNIWTSPSGARVAWFQDPDGNTLSVTEFERGARRGKARPARTARTPAARPAARKPASRRSPRKARTAR